MLVKVECCVYIAISNKFDNTTCILSVLARQVHGVYAYMNQGLFLNVVTTRKMCSSKFSLKISGYNSIKCYTRRNLEAEDQLC